MPMGFFMVSLNYTSRQHSVKDDVSKNILTTVFNQLMENQRTEYIQ
ncbi:IS256 family transposase, partial [Dolosicoccus paucivorans]